MSCIPCDRWMSFGGFCLLCWTPRKLCWSVRIQVKIVARSSPVQSNVQTVEIWALTLLREAARGASTIYNIHKKKTEREAQGLKGSYRFVLETSSNSQNISDCPPMFMEFSVALPHQKPWQMHGIYNSTYHCEHPKRSKARDRDHPRAVARELHFVNVAPMTYKHAKETTIKGKKFWSKYQHHGCSLPFRGCTLNLKLSTCGLLASFSCCRHVPQKGMIAFYTFL